MKLVNDDLSKEIEVETHGLPITYDAILSAIEQLPEGILFILETRGEAGSIARLDCFEESSRVPDSRIYGQVRFGNFYYPVIIDRGVDFPREDFDGRVIKAIKKYLRG